MNLILAQSTSLDGAMSEGLGIIAKFLYIIAVIVIAHGGWQVRTGNADHGQDVDCRRPAPRSRRRHRGRPLPGGRDAHNRDRKMSKPVINTHAGDDSDGKLWGIEGINILFILAGLLLSVGLSLMLFRAAGPLGGLQFRRRLASPRPRLRLRLRAPAGQAAFLRHRSSRNPSQWAGVAAAAPPAAPPDSRP